MNASGDDGTQPIHLASRHMRAARPERISLSSRYFSKIFHPFEIRNLEIFKKLMLNAAPVHSFPTVG